MDVNQPSTIEVVVLPKEKFPIGMHLVVLLCSVLSLAEFWRAVDNEGGSYVGAIFLAITVYGAIRRKVWGRWLGMVGFGLIGLADGWVALRGGTSDNFISAFLFLIIAVYFYRKEGFFESGGVL